MSNRLRMTRAEKDALAEAIRVTFCYRESEEPEKPTIDAVPVVRCAKCKYYGPGDHAGFWRCENWGVDINRQASPPEKFYCADGERRESK